jgi:integrase
MSIWKGEWGWAAKFSFQKKQYKREGMASRTEAITWEAEKRKELLEETKPKETPLAFSDIANEYLLDCQARMQKNTWRQKAFVYRSFIGRIGDHAAINITKRQVIEHLQERRKQDGNKAANRDLRDLKALYNWAIKQEVFDIVKNPCQFIERYPEDLPERYIPPPEDIDKVLMVADRDDMDLLMVLYHTMGRVGEALRLTWEDVNFEKRWVRLLTRKRRGGELQEDYQPMNDSLYEFLYNRWKRRNKRVPWVFPNPRTGTRYVGRPRLMAKLCTKAGVREFGFHAIRHHVASILNDNQKASMKQIQKLLRHKRQATTEDYLHSIDHNIIETAKLLDKKDESKEAEKH